MNSGLDVRNQIVFQTLARAHERLGAAHGDLKMVLARLQLMNAVTVYLELLAGELKAAKSQDLAAGPMMNEGAIRHVGRIDRARWGSY